MCVKPAFAFVVAKFTGVPSLDADQSGLPLGGYYFAID
jgi:hypothetical protein